MFDNLAYDDLILGSFEICNFWNIGVYFHFKRVELTSLKIPSFYFHKTKYIGQSGM